MRLTNVKYACLTKYYLKSSDWEPNSLGADVRAGYGRVASHCDCSLVTSPSVSPGLMVLRGKEGAARDGVAPFEMKGTGNEDLY